MKETLFDCRSCGQCVLTHTAYICPMRCPKQLRNGPCGGVREGGRCEVYPEKPCVWYLIYNRSHALGRRPVLAAVSAALDWRLKNTSSWLNRLAGRDRHIREAFKGSPPRDNKPG